MAKAGRLFFPVDVNWYDEWGHSLSDEAALLWVLAACACMRMKLDGTLTLTQLRRVAQPSLANSSTAFANVVEELIGGDIAPISGRSSGGVNDGDITLIGWSEWHSLSGDKEATSGVFGNHQRWHVARGTPSLTCEYCQSEPDVSPRLGGDIGGDIGGIIAPNRNRIEKNREEQIRAKARVDDDFDQCWVDYPRKLAKQDALKAYRARRKAGVSKNELLTATQNYAKAVRGKLAEHVMYGRTFFGPSDRWKDYVIGQPETPTADPFANTFTPVR